MAEIIDFQKAKERLRKPIVLVLSLDEMLGASTDMWGFEPSPIDILMNGGRLCDAFPHLPPDTLIELVFTV